MVPYIADLHVQSNCPYVGAKPDLLTVLLHFRAGTVTADDVPVTAGSWGCLYSYIQFGKKADVQ